MKISLESENPFVWQWDTRKRVVLEGYPEGTPVHFSNHNSREALVVLSRMDGDKLVADIPPELMQEPNDIAVYICDEYNTQHTFFVSVISRTKPESYVYEPVEVLRYESLAVKIPFDGGYNGKLLYVIDGVARPLIPGEGVEIVRQVDGSYALVACGGGAVAEHNASETAHPDIRRMLANLLPREELHGAVDDALAQAKASGVFDGADGEDGLTPHIGANGNWRIGETDTGIRAQGPEGDPGRTPIKGTDYFTHDEVQLIAKQAAEMVEIPGGGGGSAGDFKYICTIAPEDAAYITINEDAEGNPLSFTEAYISVTAARASDATTQGKFSIGLTYWISSWNSRAFAHGLPLNADAYRHTAYVRTNNNILETKMLADYRVAGSIGAAKPFVEGGALSGTIGGTAAGYNKAGSARFSPTDISIAADGFTDVPLVVDGALHAVTAGIDMATGVKLAAGTILEVWYR